jgi:deoxyribonuclease-1
MLCRSGTGFRRALALCALTGLAIGLACLPAQAQQSRFATYSEAQDVFWNDLYPGAFQELYCGKQVLGRRQHNIEHVFPAFWMTKHFGCGSRKKCRRNSADFNRMEADLHNLYPTRTDVNHRRGSFPFGEVPGENWSFSACDFEEQGGIVEPRPLSRGEIARAVLYMVDAYDVQDAIKTKQLALMEAWDQADPPDAAERARNDAVERIQGNRNKFIDAHAATGPTPGSAPPAAPVTPADRDRLVRVMAWNIANLHHEIGEHLPGRPTAPRRDQADFDRIARIIADLDPDIVALQEVNGPEAVRRVLPESDWEIVVSSRFEEDLATGQDTDHIYTAVAVRKNSPAFFIAGDTVEEISVLHEQNGETRPTRRGTQVLVELPNGEPLQLMSVHLKSSCHAGSLEPPRTDACRTLAKQREPLEAWIDELTDEGTPFVIAGDWNRRIDIHGPGDHIWEELDDGEPFPLDLIRFPEGIESPCFEGTSDHRPHPIDFIVLDEQAARWVDVASARIVDFSPADRPHRKQISDHCPVVVDLVFPEPPPQ